MPGGPEAGMFVYDPDHLCRCRAQRLGLVVVDYVTEELCSALVGETLRRGEALRAERARRRRGPGEGSLRGEELAVQDGVPLVRDGATAASPLIFRVGPSWTRSCTRRVLAGAFLSGWLREAVGKAASEEAPGGRWIDLPVRPYESPHEDRFGARVLLPWEPGSGESAAQTVVVEVSRTDRNEGWGQELWLQVDPTG